MTIQLKPEEEIIDYFSNRNLEAGERFINEFEKKCKYLANFPNMGRSYDDIKPFLRGLPLASYIIFYIEDFLEENVTAIASLLLRSRAK
jgi:toxin ParE1/3/4